VGPMMKKCEMISKTWKTKLCKILGNSALVVNIKLTHLSAIENIFTAYECQFCKKIMFFGYPSHLF